MTLHQPYPDGTVWRFQYIGEPNGHLHQQELFVQYELAGERWAEDEYFSDNPSETWASWRAYLDAAPIMWHPGHGRGWVQIQWGIVGEGTSEHAPIVAGVHEPTVGPTFATYFSTPTNVETGEAIDWTRLQLVDQAWRGGGRLTGFVYRSTGWTPAPFQAAVNIDELSPRGDWS